MADSSILNLPNEMVVKPAAGDKFAIADVSVPAVGETKKIAYSTLTADFLMTNEARTITTGGLTVNDGVKIKIGTDGDLEFYHSDPISYISNVKTSGKIHIQATNAVPALVDMLILDPTGPTIAVGAANIARENNATHGIDFDASGNTQIKKELETIGKIRLGENIDIGPHRISGDGVDYGFTMTGADGDFSNNLTINGELFTVGIIRCGENIDLDANFISGDGSDSGLSMTGAAAMFSSTVEITDKLTMLENIDMGLNRISGDGADHGLSWTGGENAVFSGNVQIGGILDQNNAINLNINKINYSGTTQGLYFASGNLATFTEHLDVKDEISCDGLNSSQDIYSGQHIASFSYIRSGNSLDLRDGISAPSTIPAYARIFVDSGDGDLKVRFGDGTIKTIVTDT